MTQSPAHAPTEDEEMKRSALIKALKSISPPEVSTAPGSRTVTIAPGGVTGDRQPPATKPESAPETLSQFQERTAKEWLEGSGVNDALFRNIVEVSPDTVTSADGQADHPLHTALHWRKNRSGEGMAIGHGAIIYTLDPQNNWERVVFQVKLATPRPDPDKQGKVIKYETPAVKGQVRGGFAPADDATWELVSQRYGVPVEESDRAKGFWQWVVEHPEIPVTVTEGMKKASCLLSMGNVAMALSGITMGVHQPTDDSERQLRPFLQAFAQPGRQVHICFDAETKAKTLRNVRWEAKKLADCFEQSGCPTKVVQLPLLPGTDKTGVDDWAVSHGDRAIATTEFDKLLNQAITAEQLMKKPLVIKRPKAKATANADTPSTPMNTAQALEALAQRINKLNNQLRKVTGDEPMAESTPVQNQVNDRVADQKAVGANNTTAEPTPTPASNDRTIPYEQLPQELKRVVPKPVKKPASSPAVASSNGNGRANNDRREFDELVASINKRTLEEVISSLGFTRAKGDKRKWKREAMRISIDENKGFYDHVGEHGGKTPISLAMYTENLEFKEAVSLLSGRSLSIIEEMSSPRSSSTKAHQATTSREGVQSGDERRSVTDQPTTEPTLNSISTPPVERVESNPAAEPTTTQQAPAPPAAPGAGLLFNVEAYTDYQSTPDPYWEELAQVSNGHGQPPSQVDEHPRSAITNESENPAVQPVEPQPRSPEPITPELPEVEEVPTHRAEVEPITPTPVVPSVSESVGDHVVETLAAIPELQVQQETATPPADGQATGNESEAIATDIDDINRPLEPDVIADLVSVLAVATPDDLDMFDGLSQVQKRQIWDATPEDVKQHVRELRQSLANDAQPKVAVQDNGRSPQSTTPQPQPQAEQFDLATLKFWQQCAKAIGKGDRYRNDLGIVIHRFEQGRPIEEITKPSIKQDVMEGLRRWYATAREMGKPKEYLDHIKTVALEFDRQDRPIPESVLTEMQRDIQQRQQTQKQPKQQKQQRRSR